MSSLSISSDCLLKVFRSLPPRDVAVNCSRVCRTWRQVASDQTLWRQFCKQLGLSEAELEEVEDFKDLFEKTGEYKSKKPVSRSRVVELIYERKVFLAQLLIRRSKGLPKRRGIEESPLYVSALLGDNNMVRFLMTPPCEAFEVIDATETGSTALHAACRKGHLECARSLLELRPAKVPANFLVNQRDDAGWSSLLLACVANSTAIAQLLLSNGADVKVKTQQMQTALHVAAAKDNAEVIKLLLTAGAEMEAVDSSGKTPLLVAVIEGAEHSVRTLISAGASTRAKHDDLSCIEWAELLELDSIHSLLDPSWKPPSPPTLAPAPATAPVAVETASPAPTSVKTKPQSSPITPKQAKTPSLGKTKAPAPVSASQPPRGDVCIVCARSSVLFDCADCKSVYCNGCVALVHSKGSFCRHHVTARGEKPSGHEPRCDWCERLVARVMCSECELRLCNSCSGFLHGAEGLGQKHNPRPLSVEKPRNTPVTALTPAQAQEYLQQHQLQTTFEQLFTDMLLTRPPSPLGYLARRLAQREHKKQT